MKVAGIDVHKKVLMVVVLDASVMGILRSLETDCADRVRLRYFPSGRRSI